MITMLLIGFGALVALAVIVGIVDAARSADRRYVAAERRMAWERRQQHQRATGPAGDEDDD